MIYKDFQDRSGIRATLEYFLRANDDHEHAMGNIVFVQGSAISDDPISINTDGTAEVNLDELVAEFEQQAGLYVGTNRDGKLYNHSTLTLRYEDSLTDKQWAEVIEEFQAGMGYEFDNSLFCGGIHKEKKNLHLHIGACRVDSDGKLISKHNHYEKAQRVRDRICQKFGLTAPENSFDFLSKNASNDHLDFVSLDKARGNKFNKDFSYVDERNLIRTKIKQVFEHDKPSTITDYVKSLKKRGVTIEAREDKVGECMGISYKLKGSDKSHSGSNISSTHASWGSLLNPERKGLNYHPARDNPTLGLTGIRVKVKVTKKQVSTIKRLRLNVIVRRYEGQYYADLAFRCGDVEMLAEAIMEMILKTLALIFCGGYARTYTPLELSRSIIEHDTNNETVYDGSDIQQCMQNVMTDAMTWKDEDSDTTQDLCFGWDKTA
ncbi:relaxase/mobilization nuclease domain-containing protein [Shewanella sp. H8]|uniref:relaxase/mobilization nuclease domain-containing protein n=1 Tax=Shewanella sp. H8 TaxID=3342676 RepID=UPI003314A95E